MIVHARRLHPSYFLLTASLLLATLLVASCHKTSGPGGQNSYRPYSIQHAILHFEYFGDSRGTEDIYIDSFGHSEAHYIHSEHISSKGFEPTITLNIRHWATTTVVDSGHGQTVRLQDPALDSMYRLSPSDVPTPEEQFGRFFSSLKYHPVGDTLKAGIRMHTWQFAGDPLYVYEWHGVTVGRRTGQAGFGMELRLLSVDTTTPVDPARFQAPTTYPIHDLATPPPGTVPPEIRKRVQQQ